MVSMARGQAILDRYKEEGTEYSKYASVFSAGKRSEEEELAGALSMIEEISKKNSCDILNIKPR